MHFQCLACNDLTGFIYTRQLKCLQPWPYILRWSYWIYLTFGNSALFLVFLLIFNGNNESFLYFTAYACFPKSMPFRMSFTFLIPGEETCWTSLKLRTSSGEERPCYMSGIWRQGWEVWWPSFRVKEEGRREEERENRVQGDESNLSHPVIKGRLIVADTTCGKWMTLTVTVICQDWPQKRQT